MHPSSINSRAHTREQGYIEAKSEIYSFLYASDVESKFTQLSTCSSNSKKEEKNIKNILETCTKKEFLTKINSKE